jgi:outer membrane protein, heavy metal efflux system
MHRKIQRDFWFALVLTLGAAGNSSAQSAQSWTWENVKDRFEQNNPTLLADKLSLDESKAQEITAYLRPNPNLNLLSDQITPFNVGPSHGPLAYLLPSASVDYLHERDHKRELRRESTQRATGIAAATYADTERTLLFNLRSAFVSTLQAKAVVKLAIDNLAYYDRALGVSRDRFSAGDIAQIDLDRLELQRVQYESDLQTALVNQSTAKIQLRTLLNDRTPIEQFDIIGAFDFSEQLLSQEEFRKIALDARPDLQAAVEAVAKAQTDHKLAIANGSTDPTFSLDAGRNPPIDFYFGVGVSIPLRIFDRNQGEKLRTRLDIGRQQRLLDASKAQVFSDVDTAYAQVSSNVILLQPYKAKYLQTAVRVRDTMTFSYQHGGASLLDFLNAENEYRTVQLSYVNLVGAYLTAAAQLNMAVGREVIP